MAQDILTGSCHCGAVHFEISRPDHVTACNCSICRRYAALWAYAPPARLALHAPQGSTRSYSWGDKTIAFHSCATCGVVTHYESLVDERVAVNMRNVDDPTVLASLRLRHFDGANTWTFLD